jgi:hypothetical protein
VIKGNVVPIVDIDKERDYRKVPPSWRVYTFPRSNMSRFEPAKTDELGLLGKKSFFC